MRKWLTFADFSDPAGMYARRQKDAALDLKGAEINIRAEVEAAKLRQGQQHHENDLELGYADLRLQAEMESRKLEQESQQHADKMGVLARQDELDRQRFAIAEKKTDADIALGREQLEWQREHAVLSARVSLETVRVQAASSEHIAAMQIEATARGAEVAHAQAVELANLTHSNQVAQIEATAHADVMKSARAIPFQTAYAEIERTTAVAQATANALANAHTERMRGMVSMKMEEQKERHRSNERRHEIRKMILQERLHERAVLHEEITKLIVRLNDPTTSSADVDSIIRRYEDLKRQNGLL